MLPVNPMNKKGAMFIANGRRIVIIIGIIALVAVGVLVAVLVL